MNRGASPVVAVPLLVGVTLVLVAVLGTTAFGIASPPDPVEPVVLSVAASPDGEIELVHEAGPPVDVTAVEVRIAVDGEALDHQPPVPFFSAKGFQPGPTGPFNSAADPEWNLGERASLGIAGTNDPELEPGSRVTVRLVRDGLPVARGEAVVRA